MRTIGLNTFFDHLRCERNCHLAAFGETWFSLHLCERGIEGGEQGRGCPIIGEIGVEVSETAIVAVIRRRFTCACIAQKIVDIRQRRARPSPWSGGV
jgi:hypothetical protein